MVVRKHFHIFISKYWTGVRTVPIDFKTNHMPDLSVRNIAFASYRLSNCSQTDIYEVVGSPTSEPLIRLDGACLDRGVPEQFVKSATWDDWIDEDDEDIKIIDLGEGFAVGNAPQELCQPEDLQALETIFMNNFDYQVDLWRSGLRVSLPF
jgi:serine/threonine-protein kinase SRPK3